jgi:hypothetical protein
MMFLPLEELDVGSVKKVPRFHGAEAPGEPLAAAFEKLFQSSVMCFAETCNSELPFLDSISLI